MASPMTSARTTLPAQRPATTSTTTTTVVTETSPAPIIIPSSGTLRLRGVRSPDRHIQWADDVIDNEGMGRKSSKVCCIYHKVRSPGESSSDESSDSSESDSDSEPDNSRARPIGGAKRRPHRHHHRRRNHDGGPNDEGDSEANGGNGSPKRRARRPSPNAYERMPKYGKKKADGSS